MRVKVTVSLTMIVQEFLSVEALTVAVEQSYHGFLKLAAASSYVLTLSVLP